MMRRLQEDSTIMVEIQRFMPRLSDAQLQIVYAGAAAVADYSCLAKTVREIDDALWQEAEKELKVRGIDYCFAVDLKFSQYNSCWFSSNSLADLEVVTMRVLGSCLEAARHEYDSLQRTESHTDKMLTNMIDSLAIRLGLEGLKIADAYSLKPEDLP